MENWKERLVKEQAELKERLARLVEFINSEKFYELSANHRQLLKNQKIAMELYLSVLNMRLYEDVDNVTIPDMEYINLFGSLSFSHYMNPTNDPVPCEKPCGVAEPTEQNKR